MKSKKLIGLGIAALAVLGLAHPVSAAPVAGGQGTDSGLAVSALSASAVNEAITRAEVIDRAKSWLTAINNGPVPYDMNGSFGGYRSDCSGFVSMAWKLGGSLTTVTIPGVSSRIAKDDLMPGDVLGNLGPGTGGAAGHVVLFEAWANEARTRYIGIEQAGSPGHTVRREIPYPYFSGNYQPWRYNKIADARPVDRVSDINSDGFGDLVGVDGNGELFGYHNASLVSGDRSPFTGETWRYKGSNWSGISTLASGDVTGDGYADLVGVEGNSLVVYGNGSVVNQDGKPFSGGETFRYEGNWSNVSHLAIADVTGDGWGDLVAVERTGAMVVYANGTKVNPGGKPFGGETWRYNGSWGSVKQFGVSDVNRDGYGDIVAVDANGELFGYNNASLIGDHRPFTGETWRVRGSNWSGVKQFTVMDATGDGFADIVAVEPDGKLSMYGNGSLVNPGGVPFSGRTWMSVGDWSAVRTFA
ncbi:hypothetical protein JNUCC0626_25035 [Lentzea sp. JNUCC 0626]|uniref:C40 family peptidase n=1 Tax=Lentzea sp. JNUCC 0626 TaxID=3367513 RepID=UPI003748108B